MNNKKDKPGAKKSMREMMNLNPEELSNIPSEENYAPAFEFTDEFDEKLKAYNERIKDIHPDYGAFKPYDKILVRLYTRPLERNSSGLVIPHYEPVQIPTRSNVGNAMVVPSPYPFTRKAVIVALPEVDYIKNRFNIGDTLILAQKQVVARSIGSGDDAAIDIPNKFFLPDFYDRAGMPIDPEDKNYGYILIEPRDIEGSI